MFRPTGRASLAAIALLVVTVYPVGVRSVKFGDEVFPDQWEHKYHQQAEGDFVVRQFFLMEVHPRSALLCPKGFAIARITMLIKTGQDIIEAHPSALLEIPYAHWLIKPDDGVYSDEEKGKTKCPTLQMCLGYQACLFNFGIEFCHMDPIPGQRKNLLVTLTCVRDERLLIDMKNVNYDEEYMEEIRRRINLVLHLTYTSRLEVSVDDYSGTEIRKREENEDEIFYGICPPREEATKAGYRGQCHQTPPGPEDVSEALWSLLGRVPSNTCRKEIQEIYCSFLYHNKGLCLPPFVLQPGQSNDSKPEDLLLADNSFPRRGPRPDTTQHDALMTDPHRNLIPVRLGFVILAHKDPPSVMQLLSLIYRPHHYYAIHVDARQTEIRDTLTSLIATVLPGATNIRILPPSRSFVASWGSFNIVRAELESFEELLRMGPWDFGVKLSGADMPIRDVDDLSAALAPYRGVSFVPLFGQRNDDMKAEQGLVWDVWHGCEGYVYNVSRGGGQPFPEEIPIYTGSQWSIMARNLWDYAVTFSERSNIINRWHYHLQTSIIPDESYFPTVAMNSPFASNCRPLGFHWLKRFEGRNVINLCRHMEDTDFCGQGPGPVEEGDMNEMMESSHRYFFARKFHTDTPTNPIRIKVAEHVRSNYYQNIRKYVSRAMLRQLGRLAFQKLESQIKAHPTLSKVAVMPGDVINFKVLPRLHLTNPCCALPYQRSFKSTQEFIFWVDFNIVEENGSVIGGARAVIAQRAACDCYPDGHLRALRVTTWPEDPNNPKRSALTTNVPLPFAMPGADTIYPELWFHVGSKSVNQECQGRIRPPGRPMEFPNMKVHEVTADPLHIVVQMIDPKGNVRCEERKIDYWDRNHVHVNRDRERVEMPSFFTLRCGTMEPGPWKLRVFQDGVDNPRLYELPVVILPGVQDLPIDPVEQDKLDLLQGLWTVEEVALLPLRNSYGEMGVLPKREELPLIHRPVQQMEIDHEDKAASDDEVKPQIRERMSKVHAKDIFPSLDRDRRSVGEELHFGFHHSDPKFNITEWFVCGGGLLTTMMTMVFTYHWIVLPAFYSVRASPRMRRSAALIFLVVLLQIFGTMSWDGTVTRRRK
ncbi:LOW QUALITY PROTEIN: uncharacterized protein LOC135216986 [Macrobrachium nipponense]|uniref:LOW QUALITY PROTEIN: uncharacterized protein LOC135216986 n=1 Tax=Macrobrachium nipponense TaxID=159736 RepID=UPI0030C7BFF6